MTDDRMIHRPLYLRITDSSGSTHVDERQTWGQDGPERLHKSIADSYRSEWERECEQKKKEGDFFPLPRPIVSIISRDEYLRARFGARK